MDRKTLNALLDDLLDAKAEHTTQVDSGYDPRALERAEVKLKAARAAYSEALDDMLKARQ